MHVRTLCPICEENGLLEAFWVKRQLSSDLLHIAMYKCRRCGLLISNPAVDQKELDAFYSSYYSIKLPHYLNNELSEEVKKIEPRWERYYKILLDLKGAGSVMDIGCGPGHFLEYFKRDFDVYGIEPSQEAVEAAHRKGLTNIKKADLQNEELGKNRFDVVLLWHVIEHLPNFIGMLQKIYDALKDDGVLIVGTDNYASWKNKLRLWRDFLSFRVPEMYSASEHTFMFHPMSLKLALFKTGFRVISCRTYNLGKLNDCIFGGGCFLDVMAQKVRK